MIYQLDQSGKIEQTNLDTIIALSNENKYTVLLKKKDKRILQQFFRSISKPNVFIYSTFAALVAIVINKVEPDKKVIIDTEYSGHTRAIKKQIANFLAYLKYKKDIRVEFGFVGKRSPAHELASEVIRKKRKPDKVVSLEEVVKITSSKKNDRYPSNDESKAI